MQYPAEKEQKTPPWWTDHAKIPRCQVFLDAYAQCAVPHASSAWLGSCSKGTETVAPSRTPTSGGCEVSSSTCSGDHTWDILPLCAHLHSKLHEVGWGQRDRELTTPPSWAPGKNTFECLKHEKVSEEATKPEERKESKWNLRKNIIQMKFWGI